MRAYCGGCGVKCGRAGGAGTADGVTAAESDTRGGAGSCDQGARARLKGSTGAGGAELTGMAETGRWEVVSSSMRHETWRRTLIESYWHPPHLHREQRATKCGDLTSDMSRHFGVVGQCHDGRGVLRTFLGCGCRMYLH